MIGVLLGPSLTFCLFPPYHLWKDNSQPVTALRTPLLCACACSCVTHAWDPCPAEDIDAGPSPSTSMLSEAAKAHGVTLVGGSVPERSNSKLYNTCCVYDPTGRLLAKHRWGVTGSRVTGSRVGRSTARAQDSRAANHSPAHGCRCSQHRWDCGVQHRHPAGCRLWSTQAAAPAFRAMQAPYLPSRLGTLLLRSLSLSPPLSPPLSPSPSLPSPLCPHDTLSPPPPPPHHTQVVFM